MDADGCVNIVLSSVSGSSSPLASRSSDLTLTVLIGALWLASGPGGGFLRPPVGYKLVVRRKFQGRARYVRFLPEIYWHSIPLSTHWSQAGSVRSHWRDVMRRRRTCDVTTYPDVLPLACHASGDTFVGMGRYGGVYTRAHCRCTGATPRKRPITLRKEVMNASSNGCSKDAPLCCSFCTSRIEQVT